MRHLRVHGGFVALDPQHPDVFAFAHTLDDDRLLVAINFGSAPQQFDLPADTSAAQPLLGNGVGTDPSPGSTTLRRHGRQAVVARIANIDAASRFDTHDSARR